MIARFLGAGFTILLIQTSWGDEIPAGTTVIQGITAPAVSADGTQIVFEWADDIWTASVNGGETTRIVDHAARDAHPLFTPDGKRVVFTSDRTGSVQVYSVPVGGGKARQHTWHTEGNRLDCLSPDGKKAIVTGVREYAGYRSTRLSVIDLENDSQEQRVFDAQASAATWSPDGKSILFCRRGEQLYRKGYRGSRASQIWRYDFQDQSFHPEVIADTEARSAFWQPDGKGFLFISSADGTANLWKKEIGKSKPIQLTHFKDDGMVMRVPSADHQVIVFNRGSDVFRMNPNDPEKVTRLEFWTRENLPPIIETKRITSAASADFTNDLKQAVFAASGELWWIDGPDGKTHRITQTHAAESDPIFSPDSTWLYFLRDDGRQPNFYRAKILNGQLSSEEEVTTGPSSKSRLKFCPSGKKIAWVEGLGDVFIADPNGENKKRVFKCWDRPTFDWSPDGHFIAIAAEDRHSNRDIWLVTTDGSRKPMNLTRHPAFEGSPKWSPDGRWLLFSARREEDGKSRLWRMDFGKNIPLAALDTKRIRKIADAVKPVSTGDIEPTRVIWTADSKSALFQSKSSLDPNLYSLDTNGWKIRTITSQRGIPIRTTSNGSLLLRVSQKPAIWNDGKLTRFAISASLERSRADMNQLAFRRAWRALGERFYDASMNGHDWEKIGDNYEPLATAARTSRQFDRIISRLFGELNASHLSFGRRSWPGEYKASGHEKKTAHPGIVFQPSMERAPLTIARVIRGTAASRLRPRLQAGDTVLKIGGMQVDSHTPLHQLFNGADGASLPAVVRNKDGKERTIEIRCVSYTKIRFLDLSNQDSRSRILSRKAGDFTYLRVKDMKRATIDELEVEIYRAALQSNGMVLDLRNNVGGREADRLLAMFTQPEHAITIPRGGPRGYPHARRVVSAWHKPLVVLCNENTYSNAEIFCHAVKATERGKLVGNTTSGGVISAIKETIPDAGDLQVPFRGWFLKKTGKNLDLNGAQPDVRVEPTPADEVAHKDPALEEALRILKKEAGNEQRLKLKAR